MTPTLTPAQKRILLLIAEERSNLQIALAFNTSVQTVKNQVHSLYQKLHIFTRVGLTRYAIREGLIQP